jgi:hypothetical protein
VRGPREIAFRLKQELGNLRLWRFPPKIGFVPPPPKGPAATGDTAEIVGLADEILCHRFPIFGGLIETGPEIHWRRDYVHQIETGTPYFRRVPYLDSGGWGTTSTSGS